MSYRVIFNKCATPGCDTLFHRGAAVKNAESPFCDDCLGVPAEEQGMVGIPFIPGEAYNLFKVNSARRPTAQEHQALHPPYGEDYCGQESMP